MYNHEDMPVLLDIIFRHDVCMCDVCVLVCIHTYRPTNTELSGFDF